MEVSPESVPPVCRLLNYGKYKYEQAKRDRAGKHQNKGELREVRFKVKIGDHDMILKLRRAERFITEGHKVKLSVMFRGREIVHPEIGRSLLERARDHLEEIAVVEKPPTMEGRFMNMIVGPGRPKQPQPKKTKQPPTKTAAASEG